MCLFLNRNDKIDLDCEDVYITAQEIIDDFLQPEAIKREGKFTKLKIYPGICNIGNTYWFNVMSQALLQTPIFTTEISFFNDFAIKSKGSLSVQM